MASPRPVTTNPLRVTIDSFEQSKAGVGLPLILLESKVGNTVGRSEGSAEMEVEGDKGNVLKWLG